MMLYKSLNINFLKNIFLVLLTWGSMTVFAQNTIGGVKKEISQEEVTRQSAFLDAETQRMLGKYDKAIELYKTFLYNNEKNDAAWYGLARSYTEKQEFGSALDAVDKAIKIAPENKWYYLLRADIYEKNAQQMQAADVYEELTKKFPETPEFYERLAYLSVLSNNPKRGLKALDQLEKLTGITELTGSRKHLIYVGMGDNKKAAAELRKLADAYPKNVEYLRSLAKFHQENGDKAAAKSVWEEILQKRPADTEAQLALLEKGKANSDAAFLQNLLPVFKDVTVAIDLKIKELAPYFDKISPTADGQTLSAFYDLAAALETTHKDDPKAWSVAGDIYYLSGRDQDALTRYRKCISLKPRVFSVWDNALEILNEQKQYPEMVQMAEQAMDAFPNQPRAYYWYGLASNALSKPSDALPVLEQSVLMSGNNIALLLDITDQIAASLLLQKNPDGAIARLDKVMAKGGDKHPGVLERYGDALAAKGDKKAALDYWKKAQAIRSTPALTQKIQM